MNKRRKMSFRQCLFVFFEIVSLEPSTDIEHRPYQRKPRLFNAPGSSVHVYTNWNVTLFDNRIHRRAVNTEDNTGSVAFYKNII